MHTHHTAYTQDKHACSNTNSTKICANTSKHISAYKPPRPHHGLSSGHQLLKELAIPWLMILSLTGLPGPCPGISKDAQIILEIKPVQQDMDLR